MKERILKLCKRLNKFSQADIETISGFDKEELALILDELIDEKKLIKIDNTYLYQKQEIKRKKERIPCFEMQTKETNDLIIKSFCADIPVQKTALVVNLSRSTISNYYALFRNLLYEKQLKELEIFYALQAKLPSVHTLMKQKIYLYNYNYNIYISDKPLSNNNDIPKHSKDELKLIHNRYCKVRSIFYSNSYMNSFIQIAYEKVWFQNEDYNQKLSELYNLFNIS